LEAKLNDLQDLFGYPVDVRNFSNSGLEVDEYQRVMRGETVYKRIDGATHIFRRMNGTKKMWVAALEQTKREHHYLLTVGTFRLIEQSLREIPVEQWDTHIRELNEHFGFPVRLRKVNELELNAIQKQQLKQQQLLAVEKNKANERHYYLLPETEFAIGIGPYFEPFVMRVLNPALQVILALVVAFAVLIWMHPLWRGLVQIRSATEAFGRGEFTARAAVTSRSAVGQVAKTFNAMAQRIESLISSHKELTNAVSHELRTPISRLRFGMEMVQNAKDEPTRSRYLNSMNTDIDELDELVSELLTYARFDRDTPVLKFKEQSLESWLKDIVKQSNNDDSQAKIILDSLSQELKNKVYFEPKLLTRAINNLLRNAKRYAKEKVKISAEKDHNRYYIFVDDDGVGIPEAEQERIFDPFTRLDASRGRDSGGYGLGLAIVKRIMQWHNGEVSVARSRLGGARFILSWPQPAVGNNRN
jgi:signal transduction histidine kinase